MLEQLRGVSVCKGVLVLMSMALMLAIVPGAVAADTAEEVRAVIIEQLAYAHQNLKDAPDTVSKDGSIEFWSSGGLMQSLSNADPIIEYEYQTMTAKHIEVITLVEGQAAVAMYYSEGGFKAKGGNPVDNYLTRATQVFVKEDGKWKVRAAHWSPIQSGSGTNQNSVD